MTFVHCLANIVLRYQDVLGMILVVQRLISFLAILILLIPSISVAIPYYGVNVSLPLVTKEPLNLRGYQIMLNYDPERIKWRKFNVYFDAGFSHFWITNTSYYTTVNIYSMAPVVRYT